MISKVGIKALLVLCLLQFTARAQFIQSGRIVFERKTNLKKRFGNEPRMKNFITEENKYRTEQFELFFNDSCTDLL